MEQHDVNVIAGGRAIGGMTRIRTHESVCKQRQFRMLSVCQSENFKVQCS